VKKPIKSDTEPIKTERIPYKIGLGSKEAVLG
jgi:hypothetical protein